MRLELASAHLDGQEMRARGLELCQSCGVLGPRMDGLRAGAAFRLEADAPAGEEVLDDERRVHGRVDLDVRG